MRAAVLHAPKDLRIEDFALPTMGPRDVEVRIEAGGICGSDLHYYFDGGFGTIRIKQPLVLGHEIAGTVSRVGAEVSRVKAGQRVAVNPSLACGKCRYCQEGKQIHCLDGRFFGSAMRMPHVQGGFREALVCNEAQAVPVSPTTTAAQAAFGEPFAVCLHAVRRAGSLLGKRVLITGSGPIGALTIVAAKLAGAVEVVITDVAEAPLAAAKKMGADATVNVSDPDALTRYTADKGYFDVVFEASGNARALLGAFPVLRPLGIMVAIGIGEEVPIPISVPVVKEIDLRGTFRFNDEFALSVELISSGRVDLMPLVSAVMPLKDAPEAFELAADRSRAMKVQLTFA